MQPLDTIRLVSIVYAMVELRLNGLITRVNDIPLNEGALLLSSTHNYFAKDKLVFHPMSRDQRDTILNLYFTDRDVSDQDIYVAYHIGRTQLADKWTIVESLDYNQMRPDSIPHIYLLAYLFLDAKEDRVNSALRLCFAADWSKMVQIRQNLTDGYITRIEAVNMIANQLHDLHKTWTG